MPGVGAAAAWRDTTLIEVLAGCHSLVEEENLSTRIYAEGSAASERRFN